MKIKEEYNELLEMIRRVAYDDYGSGNDTSFDQFIHDIQEQYPCLDLDEISEDDRDSMYWFYDGIIECLEEIDEELKSITDKYSNKKKYLNKPLKETRQEVLLNCIIVDNDSSADREKFSDLFKGYMSLDKDDIDELFAAYKEMFDSCMEYKQSNTDALYSPDFIENDLI